MLILLGLCAWRSIEPFDASLTVVNIPHTAPAFNISSQLPNLPTQFSFIGQTEADGALVCSNVYPSYQNTQRAQVPLPQQSWQRYLHLHLHLHLNPKSNDETVGYTHDIPYGLDILLGYCSSMNCLQ